MAGRRSCSQIWSAAVSTSSQRAMAAAESPMGVVEAARHYGVSAAYVSRAVVVLAACQPEVIEAVRSGDLTVNAAWRSRGPVPDDVTPETLPYGGLTVRQVRGAMAKYLGFDVIRDDFTTDLLEQVPHVELLDFMERLALSRTATENLINEIRKITEKGTT